MDELNWFSVVYPQLISIPCPLADVLRSKLSHQSVAQTLTIADVRKLGIAAIGRRGMLQLLKSPFGMELRIR